MNRTFTPRFRGVEAHGPYHLLADSLAETGDPEGAEEAFRKALEISPDAAGVRHGLGTFLVKNDRAHEAVQLLFEAIEEDLMTPTLWSLGCNIVNGHLDDTEIALHWTDCAAQDHPDHPEITKQRGIALLTAGQFKVALPLFEALPKHPANLADEAPHIAVVLNECVMVVINLIIEMFHRQIIGDFAGGIGHLRFQNQTMTVESPVCMEGASVGVGGGNAFSRAHQFPFAGLLQYLESRMARLGW